MNPTRSRGGSAVDLVNAVTYRLRRPNEIKERGRESKILENRAKRKRGTVNLIPLHLKHLIPVHSAACTRSIIFGSVHSDSRKPLSPPRPVAGINSQFETARLEVGVSEREIDRQIASETERLQPQTRFRIARRDGVKFRLRLNKHACCTPLPTTFMVA